MTANKTIKEIVAEIDELILQQVKEENERLKDLLQQVCEECAFGEQRDHDPVFGNYVHPVDGVYGVRSVPCGVTSETSARITEARLAERERCAMIADGWANQFAQQPIPPSTLDSNIDKEHGARCVAMSLRKKDEPT